MTEKQSGILMKCIGGFYYVEVADTVYTCKARGVLRQQGISPVAGDRVEITLQEDGTGTLETVLPRKNCLVRPPVANVDLLVTVVSVADPAPNLQVLDSLIAVAESREIEPILVINKTDLADGDELAELYRRAGFTALSVCARQPETVAPLREILSGKVAVFTGNSGVGKSSILNALEPSLTLQTGEISRHLGRGRHTTRCASLFRIGNGYMADTSGFSSVNLDMVGEELTCDRLFFCFREFEKYFGKCRFSTCTHTREPACAVRDAVQRGEIAPSRYASYELLYEQLKGRKDWEA